MCCVLLVGCQGGDPQPVPVSGVVRFNSKPLDHGKVMFIPDDTERGHSGRGQIGPDGRYSLMTFTPNDGVLPGSYTVAVSCYELSEKLGVPAVPERYLDPKISPLRAEVGYFATVVNLELEGEVDGSQSMMGRNQKLREVVSNLEPLTKPAASSFLDDICRLVTLPCISTPLEATRPRRFCQEF